MPVIVPFALGDKPAHMDQFLSMSCVISDGDLPLNIFWTFNNQPITSDMDVSVSKLGKRSSVLSIDSVSGHHAGNYTCHGKNGAGSTTYSTELKVIGALNHQKRRNYFKKLAWFGVCVFRNSLVFLLSTFFESVFIHNP